MRTVGLSLGQGLWKVGKGLGALDPLLAWLNGPAGTDLGLDATCVFPTTLGRKVKEGPPPMLSTLAGGYLWYSSASLGL